MFQRAYNYLVEAFKGQLYTFVGDNSEEKSMAISYESYDKSLDNHEESNRNLKVNSKESKHILQ